MKSIFRGVFLGSFITITMSNCVKELVVRQNGYQAKPLIWAIFNPDSFIKITTSGNRGIDENNLVNISGLTVYLYENGNKIDSLLNQSITSDSQVQFFNRKPKIFTHYQLIFTNPSNYMEAGFLMPNLFDKPEELTISQGNSARLNYTITDDITNIDAYQFKVQMNYMGILMDTSTNLLINNDFKFVQYYDKFDESTASFDFLGLGLINSSDYTFPVSDNLFNGKRKNFLFTINNPVSNQIFIPVAVTNTQPISNKLIIKKQYVLVTARKISSEYYNFKVSENKNNSIMGTSYFNPTNLYSNFKGSLGLLAGLVERTDTLWIRK